MGAMENWPITHGVQARSHGIKSVVFLSHSNRNIILPCLLIAIMAHNEDISSDPTHDRFNVAEEKRQARVAELTDNVTGEYVGTLPPA